MNSSKLLVILAAGVLIAGCGGTTSGSRKIEPQAQSPILETLNSAADSLEIPAQTHSDLDLPTQADGGVGISWSSSDTTMISAAGDVTRPDFGTGHTTVSMTATLSLDGEQTTRVFDILVMATSPAYGRIASYSFEGNLQDTLGYFSDGAITGSRLQINGDFDVSYDDGLNNAALALDGNHGVRLPDNLISTFQYSVTMWLRPASFSQYTPAFFGAASDTSWINLAPASWNYNTMLWSGSNWYDADTHRQIPANTWSHIAFTVDQGAIKVFLNGELAFAGDNFPDIFSASNSVFAVGANYWDSPYHGLVDELRIYNTALTADEIWVLDIENAPEQDLPERALAMLDIGDTNAITADLPLVKTGPFGSEVKWWTSDTDIITTDGRVTRPAAGQPDAQLTLFVILTLNGVTITEEMRVTVLAETF